MGILKMEKEHCIIGQNVIYSPEGRDRKLEFGVVTGKRDNWAMVHYDGDNFSKATYYSDLQPV